MKYRWQQVACNLRVEIASAMAYEIFRESFKIHIVSLMGVVNKYIYSDFVNSDQKFYSIGTIYTLIILQYKFPYRYDVFPHTFSQNQHLHR